MARPIYYVLIAIPLLLGVAHADDAKRFRSNTVGFEVGKPDAWHFVTADENLENLQRMRLKDEEFQALAVKYATAPLVAMTKYKEPFDDLNPSFKVNIRPIGQFSGQPPTEILRALLPQFQRVFKDFSLAQGPTATTVSGVAAGYMRIHYSLQVPDGRLFPTSSELWVVPRGAYFFIIGAGTRQDEKTGERREIRAILDTVRIEQ